MGADIRVELLGQGRVLRFARDEWTRLYERAGEPLSVQRVVLGTREQLRQAEPGQSAAIAGPLETARFTDEFVISQQGHSVYLIGGCERAALYAVYRYAELALGLRWIFPGEQPARLEPAAGFDSPLHEAPRLERRGFVFETIDDVPFMQGMVDWLAKNKINELFFTFTLWDKIGSALRELIADRGLDVTLGGHSASFFLDRQQKEKAAQAADHPYTAKRQLDYTDVSWQHGLIRQAADFCRDVTNLKRISLWPEDIQHQQADSFLTHYTAFTERLDEGLRRAGLRLEVEHIAYNAGLAWDMLELGGQKPSERVETLYAYWGRDYRFGPDKSESVSDQRAYSALSDWLNRLRPVGRKLTVFEYYSDHFMLSPLFPMLGGRIAEDVNRYAELGVYGMTNLVVPCRVDGYGYQWNQVFNSYAFARALWKEPADEIMRQFAAFFAAELRPLIGSLYEQLEKEVTVLTSWNVPLFPARAVDPLKVASYAEEDKKQVIGQLDRIMELAERYLAMEEMNASPQLKQTLVHYASYARLMKEQWGSLPH
ncbi:hypothetical protein D3P08_22550 [Paenibacillus nanensis]|uniref:Alpha glucuronidase N-terminal domain-containing protein n=2 Tax=Paenibacillus nanensis TaxID=393251 RepID=A0A3A1UMM2_9BACL|nr:hypothetical protein D3P08_22550 [Paenibacillus nanensis]